MKSDEQRKMLHQYIEIAEEEEIEAMYSVLKQTLEKPKTQLSDIQKKELNKRLAEYELGLEKSFNWNDTITMTRLAVAGKNNY